MADNNMNIMFKRGVQADLDKLSKSDVGCFYLTTDTNRLYVGQNENQAPFLLNQTVQIVSAVSSLPTNPAKNDFYYCTSENILAVYTGETGTYDASKWKQINQNTNDTIAVTNASFGAGDVSDSKDSITYDLTLTQKKYNEAGQEITTATIADITASLTLTSADLEAIIHDAANVKLTAESSGDTVVIKTAGDGSDATDTGLTLAAGKNASVKATGSTITVDAIDTTYTLAAAKKTENNTSKIQIGLTNNSSQDCGTAEFVAGTDLTVDVEGGAIKYSHAAITTTPSSSASSTELSHDGTFSAITGVSVNNGHVTGYDTTTFKLPKDVHITNCTQSEDWKAVLTDNASGSFTVDFSTEAGALEDSLKDHIADELARINSALTYKGTVEKRASLPTDNVEIGDVWMLSAEADGCRIGDLFIATSTDSSITVGVIPANKIEWTYVPSGDDLNTDTHFHGEVDVANNTVTYTIAANANSVGAVPDMSEDHEDLVITAGDDITITAGTDGEAIIAHSEIATSTPAATTHASKSSFTAITGITVDNGHITNIDSKTFTPESYTLSGTSNAIALKNSAGANVSSIGVGGDSTWIDGTVSNNAIKVEHKTKTTNGGNVAVTHGGQATSTDHTAAPLSVIEILSGIEYDKAGHIDSVSTGKIVLPDNTTYTLSIDGGANPTLSLTDKNSTANTVSMTGSGGINVTGTASTSGAGSLNVSFTWGTF